MIYTRGGTVCTIVREATLEDIEPFEKRKPDKIDRDALAIHNYVIVKDEDGKEWLQSISFMRADGAFTEIVDAMKAVGIDI